MRASDIAEIRTKLALEEVQPPIIPLLLLFSCSVVSDSFVTPWTIAHQALLSMGFFRQEYWNGLPFPSPGGSSRPRGQTHVSCIGRKILYHWATREAHHTLPLKTLLPGEVLNSPSASRGQKFSFKSRPFGGFPGAPVVNNPPSSAGDMAWLPGWGTKTSHAAGQLSLHTTPREKLVCRNERPHMPQWRSRVPQLGPNAAKYICI